MLFNSYTFLSLVFITFILYYSPWFSRYQIQTLILASLIFYAYNQPVLLLLLFFTVTINVVTTYLIFLSEASYIKKTFAILGITSNLLILIFFKYSPLLSKTLLDDTRSIGQFLLMVPLPIGISFFTFQGISLVIDTFREQITQSDSPNNNSFSQHLKRTFLFLSFFPKQVAGPIVKSRDFLPQISLKKLSEINWESCFKCLVIGYFLKMVVADNLKDFTFWMAYPYFQGLSSIPLIVMIYGYSCQIFADFAGYSLIAIGLANLFGYNIQQNFYFPYISTSFSEFWQRWHISLSTFLKEYLYIPLGGNRKGSVRTYINLMITMFLCGLWHGAAWSYAIWGSIHGFALATERIILHNFSFHSNRKLIKFIKGCMVFLIVTVAWLFFKLPNIKDIFEYFKSIASNFSLAYDQKIVTFIILYSTPVILYHLLYLLKENKYSFEDKYDFLAYGTMLFMIIVNSGSPNSFIYFQF